MGANETKNTTILAMDVVGYSAKMNEDERGTTEKLKNARVIIEKVVKQESGRIFNTAGDSFMVEYNSTYNAVNSAIKIQKELHQLNSKFELKDKLEFRMGVNLGDVIIDGTNLLGDGVNIAARLETVNKEFSTEIAISEEIYATLTDEFINKAKLEGEINLKGRSQKTNVYSIN